MKKSLNGTWQGRCLGAEGFSFTGTVPGCVHTDLMGVSIPADLQWGRNADECQWIENCDWEYSRTFTGGAYTHLVFEGLDTYAHIYLNGQLLGEAADMFIPHRFPVAGLLREGENTLTVRFRSPIKETEGVPERRAAFGSYQRLYTRRMQCTYGWDWVARFVTCGIWRDVYLENRSGFGVKDVYIVTESIAHGVAQISVEAEFENYENGGMAELVILDPDGCEVYRHSWYRQEAQLRACIDIPDARLWYPASHGQQPLYTLILCGREQRFGIRTVVIRQLPDKPGDANYQLCRQLQETPSGKKYDHNPVFSGFQLLINGVPVLCKGANWVPSEPFPSAQTDAKQTTLLELAREAGVNMLRVWGGGIFERQHFYSECDRLGILVTQDFLMACGTYPEDEAFLDLLQQETEAAALALRNHPCLVWWSGDNENAVNGNDTMETYRGRTAIYRGIEPVLMRLDPRRRFLPSSPCFGDSFASKTVGTTHNTQFLGSEIFPYIFEGDFSLYKETFGKLLARFIAEEPTFGATCLPSLKKFMTEEEIFRGTDLWQYHTKGNPALKFTLFDMLQVFSQKLLGSFRDGHDRFFKLKYAQYEWVRVTLENVRRNQGFCNGMIYWMWNDCWAAAAGWSFVDYYCLPKAGFYSFKRCAKPLVVCLTEDGIWLCNDSPTAQTVTVKLYRLPGGVTEQVVVAEPGVTRLPTEQAALLVCDVGCDRSFYRKGALPLVPAEVRWTRSGNTVTVQSDGYVHCVELEGSYIFEDNYFSLLPGEMRTVQLRPAECSDGDDLTVIAYTIDN